MMAKMADSISLKLARLGEETESILNLIYGKYKQFHGYHIRVCNKFRYS